ncbi:MAG: DUF4870 domain-containing protein [Actinomadura sp.]
MSTQETPQSPDQAETSADHGAQPSWSQDNPLTASDVKTYATLAHVGVVLLALIAFPLMWAPPLALFLIFRTRDQAGLLRRHLGQALSFSAVLTIYAVTVHQVLAALEIDHLVVDLLPVVLAAIAVYPTLRAVQAVRRMAAYTHPKPLAWIPLDQ